MNAILCPDNKGQSPKARRSPPKVPVLAKRRQISAGGFFRARFPHPTQLSSLRELGAQLNWPSVSSVAQREAPGLTDCDPDRRPLLLGCRDRYGGKAHRRPEPQIVEGFSEGSGAQQDIVPSLFPGPPCSAAGPRLGKLKGLQQKA